LQVAIWIGSQRESSLVLPVIEPRQHISKPVRWLIELYRVRIIPFQITFLCLASVTMVYARPEYYAAGLTHAAPLPVQDTPEVAAAKAAHFAAYNAAAAAAAASPDHGAYVYTGPLAGVPVIVSGVPVDTPEVATAKAAHFAAHAQARGHYYG
jgi:hypothetical protein